MSLGKSNNSLFSYWKQFLKIVKLFSLPGSVQMLKKSTSWTSVYHLKFHLICLFWYKTHSRYDVIIHWCLTPKTFCHALLQITLPTNIMFAAVQAHRDIFPSFNTLLQSILFSNLPRLVLLNVMLTPLSFAESKIQVIIFCQVAPLCMMHFRNMESRDMFRIKRCWNVPKIMEIGSGILKM